MPDDARSESSPLLSTFSEERRRALGLPGLTASGVGIVIGAGIYVLLGAAAAEAGTGVWLAFLAAGLLSAFTALSYAELASMFPTAGAEYEYTRHVAPTWAAFLVGWLMIAGLVVAAAAVALGFANYVAFFVDVPERLAALALIVLVTGIALFGIRQSSRVTIALTVVQVGGCARRHHHRDSALRRSQPHERYDLPGNP